MTMLKILFVCVHNSARSQMAEEILRLKLHDKVQVQSAGLEPGILNPYAVQALQTLGIDISGKRTASVFDLYRNGDRFHYVITVCNAEAAERCPVFPGALKYLHWSFADPASFTGTPDEILCKTLEVMCQIEAKIDELITELPI